MNVGATTLNSNVGNSYFAAGIYRQPLGNQVMASATPTRGYGTGGVPYNPPPLQQTMLSPRQYSLKLNSQTMNFTGNPPQSQTPDSNANADPNAVEQPVLANGSPTAPNRNVAITKEQVPDYAVDQAEAIKDGPDTSIGEAIAKEEKSADEVPRENRTAEENLGEILDPKDTVTVA